MSTVRSINNYLGYLQEQGENWWEFAKAPESEPFMGGTRSKGPVIKDTVPSSSTHVSISIPEPPKGVFTKTEEFFINLARHHVEKKTTQFLDKIQTDFDAAGGPFGKGFWHGIGNIIIHPIEVLKWSERHVENALGSIPDTHFGMFIQGTTAIIGAAMIIALAYHIYNRYFSEMARGCRKYKHGEWEDCINEYKKRGVFLRIKTLQLSMKNCDHSKEPEKCKRIVAKTISELKAKAASSK